MSNPFDDMGRRSQAELADQVAQHTANKVKKEPENQERYPYMAASVFDTLKQSHPGGF
jgi:hypothetical protein